LGSLLADCGNPDCVSADCAADLNYEQQIEDGV
jgi:hypothetical protein